jgi:plastocyanin
MGVARLVMTIWVCAFVGACGGSSSGGGSTNPPPPAAVSSVSLSQTQAVLRPTETTSITATPKDASGNTLSGRTVSWTVTPTSVATIAPNGASVTVTAVANGQAQVTATVEGVSNTAGITVTTSFPTSASVTVGAGGGDIFDPAQADIASGGTVTFSWAGGVTHNVTWQSPPGTVSDITDRSSGSVPVTLSTPGTYNYHCTIHAGMNGTITVH